MSGVEDSRNHAELPHEDGVEILPKKILPYFKGLFLFSLFSAVILLYVTGVYQFFGLQRVPFMNKPELIFKSLLFFEQYGCQSILSIDRDRELNEIELESINYSFDEDDFDFFLSRVSESEANSWGKTNQFYFGYEVGRQKHYTMIQTEDIFGEDLVEIECTNVLGFGGEEYEVLTFQVHLELSSQQKHPWSRGQKNDLVFEADIRMNETIRDVGKMMSRVATEEFGIILEAEEFVPSSDEFGEYDSRTRFVTFSISKSNFLEDTLNENRKNEIEIFVEEHEDSFNYLLSVREVFWIVFIHSQLVVIIFIECGLVYLLKLFRIPSLFLLLEEEEEIGVPTQKCSDHSWVRKHFKFVKRFKSTLSRKDKRIIFFYTCLFLFATITFICVQVFGIYLLLKILSKIFQRTEYASVLTEVLTEQYSGLSGLDLWIAVTFNVCCGLCCYCCILMSIFIPVGYCCRVKLYSCCTVYHSVYYHSKRKEREKKKEKKRSDVIEESSTGFSHTESSSFISEFSSSTVSSTTTTTEEEEENNTKTNVYVWRILDIFRKMTVVMLFTILSMMTSMYLDRTKYPPRFLEGRKDSPSKFLGLRLYGSDIVLTFFACLAIGICEEICFRYVLMNSPFLALKSFRGVLDIVTKDSNTPIQTMNELCFDNKDEIPEFCECGKPNKRFFVHKSVQELSKFFKRIIRYRPLIESIMLLLQASLFAYVHMIPYCYYYLHFSWGGFFLFYFVMGGLVPGIIYFVERDLWVVILWHAMYDFLVISYDSMFLGVWEGVLVGLGVFVYLFLFFSVEMSYVVVKN